MKPSIAKRTGVTLTEVVMSTLMVGVVLVAALDTVGASLRTSRASIDQSEARRLAEALLEEALALPYSDPQGQAVMGIEEDETEPAENRLGFDDLDDYDGWLASPPQESDGVKIEGYTGWKRRVMVRYAQVERSADGTLPDLNSDTGLKRIVVEVTDESGKNTTVTALRSVHGVHEMAPAIDSEWVASVGVQARVGNGESVSRSHSLTNRAAGP